MKVILNFPLQDNLGNLLASVTEVEMTLESLASARTKGLFADQAEGLRAFGLSEQAIKQVLGAMEAAYWCGRSDEVADRYRERV